MHDVTEQKRVEEELRESERQFKALTDATLEAIIITEQGKVLEVNRAYTTLFGYEPSEIVGRSALEMAAPESQDLIRDNISSGFEGSYEAVGLRKDGTRFDIEIHGTASRYRDRPARIAAIRDITERKRAEAEIQELNENLERRVEERTAELEAAITELRENEQRLHQSEDRLRLAVESTGLGTWDYDPVTGELRWDERCREIFGVSPDAAVDYETFLSGLHPEDRERTDRMVQATLNPESGGYFETEYRTIGIEDGIERWAAAHGKAFFDESGRAVRFIGTLLDITERKRAEEEVRQLNRTLEQRVEERTAQLEAAMSMADAANRAKSEFLANMSHEIRTPMNGVIGMTGLLLDTELSDEQSEYTETIRTSGENLMTVINDILDFSKIEAGRMDLEVIDFDLRPTVEETVGLLAERAYGKGLELISIVDSRVPAALRGDPGRIRQVLTNLLGNAVKLTERGEVLLRVSPDGERPGNKTVVRFSITDTGIGMTEDQRARLFRSFTQADASTTRKYGGTGLGLAISKQLVELMGGEIGVETEPGVGSCFWFAVPLEKQLDGERDGGLPVGSDLGDVRVLIVDDNETNRKILREQLAVLQMRSELAKDGPHALEALRSGAERNEPFDLVALDMRMPGMNGMQLARKIKTDPMISPARLLLLTSLGNRGEGEEARRAGIEAYLTKPVRQSELYDTIATLMGRSSSASGKTILVTRHALREREAGGRGRLLVVEDNAVNQKVAVKMLERLGYRADVAGNGREAVEAVSRIHYNAVLMDVQMPEMNGYEATREIRRREDDTQGCRTPIIAMTANAMQGDRENTLKAGMDDYVSKPVKPEALDEVLERWVRREKDGSLAGDDTADAASLEEDAKDSLDLSVLEGLRELQEEGEPGFLEELIELFLSDVPPRLEALRRATEEGDASSVERIAHTLKGSTGNLGALGMADLCEQLQGIGRSEDLAAAPVCFSHLEEEFERVRTALGEELEGN